MKYLQMSMTEIGDKIENIVFFYSRNSCVNLALKDVRSLKDATKINVLAVCLSRG